MLAGQPADGGTAGIDGCERRERGPRRCGSSAGRWEALAAEALDAEKEGGLVGYVEVHLEQGPVLGGGGICRWGW